MTRDRESSLAAAEPSSHIAPYGGATFNLEEGMIVPYLEPGNMGLSSPIGGMDLLFTFILTNHTDDKTIMISEIGTLHRPGASSVVPRSKTNAFSIKPGLVDGLRPLQPARIF